MIKNGNFPVWVLETWVVVSNIFYFHPYLGKWSNLTDIFQMGWNHQLETFRFLFFVAVQLPNFCLWGFVEAKPGAQDDNHPERHNYMVLNPQSGAGPTVESVSGTLEETWCGVEMEGRKLSDRLEEIHEHRRYIYILIMFNSHQMLEWSQNSGW